MKNYSQLENNKLRDYEMNHWKNWLEEHFDQFCLSHIIWSKVIPENWRNRFRERCIAKNQNSASNIHVKKTY